MYVLLSQPAYFLESSFLLILAPSYSWLAFITSPSITFLLRKKLLPGYILQLVILKNVFIYPKIITHLLTSHSEWCSGALTVQHLLLVLHVEFYIKYLYKGRFIKNKLVEIFNSANWGLVKNIQWYSLATFCEDPLQDTSAPITVSPPSQQEARTIQKFPLACLLGRPCLNYLRKGRAHCFKSP